VTILGASRAPAIRFAADCTRVTSFDRLLHCLTTWAASPNRSSRIGIRPSALVPPETVARSWPPSGWTFARYWEWCQKACRPYRAKTKGKVERMVRKLKESFVPGLTGQVLPLRCTLAHYDVLAQSWIHVEPPETLPQL
jgi:transposase